MKPLLACLALVTAAVLAPSSARAQAYPTKPIRVVVPFAAGATIELMTRAVLEDITRRTGAVFIVESKPGALGSIAADLVAKSPPDGYTVMPSSSATHSSGPQLVKTLPYDAQKDFTQLSAMNRFDLMLVTQAASGLRTLEQLATESKRKRLLYGYGSATGQVASSAVSKGAGILADGVAYKGQPLALNDVIGGQIHFAVSDLQSVSAQIKAGRLQPIGIASAKRSALFPDVPTLTELGAKVELAGWVGLAGPAGLSPEVRTWWARQVGEALAGSAVQERYKQMGVEPLPLAGEAFAQFVQQQYATWGRHIREAGITPE